MNSLEKRENVELLSNLFGSRPASFVVDAAGCKCSEITSLRRRLTCTGARFTVVKNTLARRALKGTAPEKLETFFDGPSAVVWSGEDALAPAKVLAEFAKENERFVIKGGYYDGEVLARAGVEALSKLPSREELLGRLLALINAPAVKLLQTMNAPASQLVRLLGAWKGELEKRT